MNQETKNQNASSQIPGTGSEKTKSNAIEAPSISLPKGGGAIRGMGEKFAANPATGTGSMSVPIVASPGRGGFGPQLALSYDSSAGNGPFGFGWNLSLPAITRKTDKGLPKYQDEIESDTFILSGAEDLVPVLVRTGDNWAPESPPDITVESHTYRIKRYRPRIEGLFARIERWAREDGDIHWRSISKDNILTIYGKDTNSRIYDPESPQRIFSWLICETRDDKGNAVLYEYKGEDGAGADLSQSHERNRGDRNDIRRTANRYLKRIHYGNAATLLDQTGQRPRMLTPAQIRDTHWMFEVAFDYGEHHAANPMPNDTGAWGFRQDAFSAYRSGFEVRTCRQCQRVLMFHHFPEQEVGANCLVRSTDFTYSYEQNPADARNPVYSFLMSVTQSGYKRQAGGYLAKSLPPLEFLYTQPVVQDTVEEIGPASLENLPAGLDGAGYQWADLHGEGIPGILAEQGGGWFYKRNISPVSEQAAGFAPLERVNLRPNLMLAGGQAQFMDLAGDGQPDLVVPDGPMPGFYEHDEDEGWQPFRPFTSRLNRDTRDPNLKFIDLDGDGHADILITEEEAFTWHPSLAEEGFGPASRLAQAMDEEKGPRLAFADGTQSIYLADLSGDGLTDLVRIRNGEVCYWPNLGYGRFGTKVTMGQAPVFDHPDQFDQKRIRLADIDGSGTTDIIYLHREGVRLYFNQCGNSWSAPQLLAVFPKVGDLVSIQAVDLQGNGTACLVWSSPLPGDQGRQMRYVYLMGGQKPHLLIRTKNNLGLETEVAYAPSTKFYLQDKQAGKPWITKLPFPVHVVEKVTVKDKWRNTSFSNTYSYHHGYFDGPEREFRGFGRVDQVDIEAFGVFAAGNANSPYITPDHTLYQLPVKTVTWFHTGAFLGRERILSQYEREYFPNWYEDLRPGETNVLGGFRENALPEPDLNALELNADEWRQALRACKGMMLRQEIYELDVDALEEQGEERPAKLFSTAYHNCHIRLLQPQAGNRHAVFLVTESEAITYHYELDLGPDSLVPDPRIAHTLNLQVDEYGNVLQSVAAVYRRMGRHVDSTLPEGAEDLVAQVQSETHLAYTETRYTTPDVDEDGHYRLRLPCEVLTYELTGLNPEDDSDRATPDPRDNRYFTLDELRRFQLSPVHQDSGEAVREIAYHRLPNRVRPEMRIVEHARMLYFNNDLSGPLPLGRLHSLGLPYETYKLALTEDLLTAVFDDKLTPEVRNALSNKRLSGYLSGDGQYWIRSGIAGFASNAAAHFYLPEMYTDPFGETTILEFDPLDLFIQSSRDPLGNTVRVMQFDYRVLAPREMRDANHNLSEVVFDALGLPAATALKGKGSEGDSLAGMEGLIDLGLATRSAFFSGSYDETEARRLLGGATARHIYHFGEVSAADGTISYGAHPPCAAGILREQHVAALEPGRLSPLQLAFEYSDGGGNVLVKKVQAEPATPGGPLRWIANGRTILNNKGKLVKQYEPSFTVSHTYEEPEEAGVTTIMYYDAPGRLIRMELPDGSYSRVEFSPWHVVSYDPSDTALEPGNAWYERYSRGAPSEQRAARIAEKHTGTPATVFLDSLGREVISIAHNRTPSDAPEFSNTPLLDRPWPDDKYLTFTKLDTEGKPLWIRDARKNLVMQYISPPVPNNHAADPQSGFVPCYDIAGNLLFQHSMDAGDRWMINDAVGQPFYAWDTPPNTRHPGHIFRTEYDQLRRPLRSFVAGAIAGDPNREILFERLVYGEAQGAALNMRGKVYQMYDEAGVVTNNGYDFKGNLLSSTRRLLADYTREANWNADPDLEDETFTSITTFDALNRPVRLLTPHNDEIPASVIRPVYNEANMLEQLHVSLRGTTTETAFVSNIDYNAKGQRELIMYGNGVKTTYEYDLLTFRLTRLTTTRETNTSLQDLSYTYDPVGNITHIQDDAQQTIFFDNQRVEPSNDYIYDALYRLIEATGREHLGQAGGSPRRIDHDDRFFKSARHPGEGRVMGRYRQRYLYDEVGNILAMRHRGTGPDNPGWKRCYQYALDSNRLRSTGDPGDPRNPDSACPTHYADEPVYAERYPYDTHGNMTAMPHLREMIWDFKDQLREVDLNGGGRAWYVYDATGQRVRKVHEHNGGLVEERIYLGGFEIYRKRSAGGLVLERETLHIMDDKQRIALVDTRTQGNETGVPEQLTRYQFGNHLGSASLELDERGAIISYEEYHPYGTTSYQAGRSLAEVSLKRYRYTGMERDEETGLNYHTARYYAPWLGRWLNPDPIGISSDINLYAFVSGNPINLIDVSGMGDHELGIITPEEAAVAAAEIEAEDLVGLEEAAHRQEESAGFSLSRAVLEQRLEELENPAPIDEDRLITPWNAARVQERIEVHREERRQEWNRAAVTRREETGVGLILGEPPEPEPEPLSFSELLTRASQTADLNTLIGFLTLGFSEGFEYESPEVAAIGHRLELANAIILMAATLMFTVIGLLAASTSVEAGVSAARLSQAVRAAEAVEEAAQAGEAAATSYGPYSRSISLGADLADVMKNQRLLSTQGWYNTAVRAYARRWSINSRIEGYDALIEFRTSVRPGPVHPSMGGPEVLWHLPEGEYLPIQLERVILPKGVTIIYPKVIR